MPKYFTFITLLSLACAMPPGHEWKSGPSAVGVAVREILDALPHQLANLQHLANQKAALDFLNSYDQDSSGLDSEQLKFAGNFVKGRILESIKFVWGKLSLELRLHRFHVAIAAVQSLPSDVPGSVRARVNARFRKSARTLRSEPSKEALLRLGNASDQTEISFVSTLEALSAAFHESSNIRFE